MTLSAHVSGTGWPRPQDAEDLLEAMARTVNTPWWRATAALERSVNDENVAMFEAALTQVSTLHADSTTVFHGDDLPLLAPLLTRALNSACGHPTETPDIPARLAIVERLLAAGADPSQSLDLGPEGHAVPLHGAATLGLWPVVERLLAAGANPNVASPAARCWLEHLLNTNDPPLIDRILDRIDLPALIDPLDVAVDWAIHGVASTAGARSTLIQDLLDRGLPLNPQKRVPSVVTACQNGCLESLTLLLARGADPQVRLTHMVHPAGYFMALFGSPPDPVLLGQSSEPGAGPDDGWGLLHLSAGRAGQASLVHRLIDLGLPVNQPSRMGFTPLHAAAMGACDVTTLEALIDRGASPTARDEAGRTAADLAVVYHAGSPGAVVLERQALHHTMATQTDACVPSDRAPRSRL